MNKVQELVKKELITPPSWLPESIVYLVYTGSVAYGASSDTSDMDCYGIAVPNRDQVFPHLRGEIPGFGSQIQRFEQWQQHHIFDISELGGKGREYDFSVYSIVKFFQLAMEGNPNIVDCLFVPHTCVLHSTQIGNLIRENRHVFLHRGYWHKFKGYAFSQKAKLRAKSHSENEKRMADIEKFGFDCKFAYHIVRLLLEIEQILTEGDMDLQRHKEQLKAIRRGEWDLDQIEQFFSDKERQLEEVYNTCTILPYRPDEPYRKRLLLQCLEMHYGSLEGVYHEPDRYAEALKQIREIVDRVQLQ